MGEGWGRRGGRGDSFNIYFGNLRGRRVNGTHRQALSSQWPGIVSLPRHEIAQLAPETHLADPRNEVDVFEAPSLSETDNPGICKVLLLECLSL